MHEPSLHHWQATCMNAISLASISPSGAGLITSCTPCSPQVAKFRKPTQTNEVPELHHLAAPRVRTSASRSLVSYTPSQINIPLLTMRALCRTLRHSVSGQRHGYAASSGRCERLSPLCPTPDGSATSCFCPSSSHPRLKASCAETSALCVLTPSRTMPGSPPSDLVPSPAGLQKRDTATSSPHLGPAEQSRLAESRRPGICLPCPDTLLTL